jgi:hypothetical protein
MAPPFAFPSSLRDLERDADGDEEPSLRPQNPVAVATLRAADLEEFVKGNLPPPTPLAVPSGGLPRSLRNYVWILPDSDFDRRLLNEISTGIGFCWSVVLFGASDLDVACIP